MKHITTLDHLHAISGGSAVSSVFVTSTRLTTGVVVAAAASFAALFTPHSPTPFLVFALGGAGYAVGDYVGCKIAKAIVGL